MINIFISSTFDSTMVSQRDLIRHEINYRLNEMFNRINENVCIVDLSLGIPKDYSPLQVVEYCIEQVRSCTFFVLILTETLGTKLSEYLKSDYSSSKYNEILKMCCEAGMCTCDLEFICAYSLHKHCILLKKEGDCINSQVNLYQSFEVDINEESFRSFSNRQQFIDIVVGHFSDIVKEAELKRDAVKGIVNNHAKLSLLAKKNRYYIPVVENIDFINNYILSKTSKTLVVYGESGKTSLLVNFWSKLCDQQTNTVYSYFANAEPALINEMVDKMLSYFPMSEAQELRRNPLFTDEYTSLNNLYSFMYPMY